MNYIKVLAIDDEPLALQQLAAYISKVPYLKLVGACASAAEARGLMEQEVIDAIFIDINMPDLNGLDFVRSLLAPPLVVFTTAYSEYAIDGFKVNALHYLLKPFSMDEFRQAAEKVRHQVQLLNGVVAHEPSAAAKADKVGSEEGVSAPQVSPFPLPDVPSTPVDQSAPADRDAIFLKTDYRVVRIDVANIRYIESMGSYLRFHLKGQQRPLMALLTMKKIEARLPSSLFLRIHRSFIVNLHEIMEVNRNQVVMNDSTSIPIGDLYRDAFSAYVNSHYLGR